MSRISLDGRVFQPVANSKGGRVAFDARFRFKHEGEEFTATYSGKGFSDGHLIGQFIDDTLANLVYHCRAENGELEAGQADARVYADDGGVVRMSMKWQWLNGSRESGTSEYREVK